MDLKDVRFIENNDHAGTLGRAIVLRFPGNTHPKIHVHGTFTIGTHIPPSKIGGGLAVEISNLIFLWRAWLLRKYYGVLLGSTIILSIRCASVLCLQICHLRHGEPSLRARQAIRVDQQPPTA